MKTKRLLEDERNRKKEVRERERQRAFQNLKLSQFFTERGLFTIQTLSLSFSPFLHTETLASPFTTSGNHSGYSSGNHNPPPLLGIR